MNSAATQNFHFFPPLIGKRLGTPEFAIAMEKFAAEVGKPITCEFIAAPHASDCEPDDPRKQFYPNEKILVIKCEDELIAIYRSHNAYDDKLDKYPDGDKPYIMPRYKLTKPFDKSLTAYLLYYLASNCHRYLEVIKSFYPTQRGGELEYDKDEAIATTSKKLKYLFDLKNTFSIKDTPDGDLKKQKIQCKHNYKKLLHELSQIIIRRADPDIDRVDAVIANALKRSTEDITHRMSEKPTLPIYGPNDELELNIRYNILALKLIVHDFNKLNGKHVDSDEHKADMNEFSQLANYLMMHAEFVPAKSDSDKIIEPNNKQVEELTGILKEIRGETAKIGAILGIVETADRTLEKVYQKRETNGYAMLDNRISKISRCAYYIDMARSTISSFIRGREELNENIQVFTDAAKLKVFTSAGSRDYNWVTESFATNTSRLMEVAESGQAHLKPEQYAQVNEFISVTYSMSETKRRQEDSIDKIKNAGATIHLS